MKKRILSLVLALCLALSLAPAAFAAGGSSGTFDGMTWVLDNAGNLTVSGNGYLPEQAFENRSDIVTATFVRADEKERFVISDNAFTGCTALTSVDFGDGVDVIGSSAFRGCTALTELCRGGALELIYDYAFAGCTALQTLTLPETVLRIDAHAFEGCTALTDVTFAPVSGREPRLYDIYAYVFAGCTSLRTLTLPETVGFIGSYAFSGCDALKTLPFDQFSLLDDYAFANCSGVTNAVLSPSLQELPDGLFDGCTGLQRVTIQDRVTDIGTGVFSGCTALTDVYYTGAQTQWNRIRTPENENVLGSAALHCGAVAHTFDNNWVETLAPTCTDDGLTSRTCTDPGCGRTQTRIVPSLGHDWDDGVTRIEPDGLLAGVVVYTCGRCALTAIELTAPEIWAYQHFTDLDPESWSYEGIQYCVATGLMSGVGGTTFLPGGVTTRAQLVQILYNLEGEPAVTGSTPFTDLTADWYQDAVTWAYQNHIVSGTSATTFAPDLVVTREQIAVVLVDFLMNIYGLERTWIPAALDVYPDGPDVSDWAQAGMSDALSLKLISGATNGESLVRHLNPRAGATRAEVATILENMCSGVLGIG